MTAQGKTTLPAEVCDALGVKPGDRLTYEIDGDQVVLAKGAAPGDGFDDMPDSDLQAMIDAALSNRQASVSIDEAFAKVRASIGARARRKNAA